MHHWWVVCSDQSFQSKLCVDADGLIWLSFVRYWRLQAKFERSRGKHEWTLTDGTIDSSPGWDWVSLSKTACMSAINQKSHLSITVIHGCNFLAVWTGKQYCAISAQHTSSRIPSRKGAGEVWSVDTSPIPIPFYLRILTETFDPQDSEEPTHHATIDGVPMKFLQICPLYLLFLFSLHFKTWRFYRKCWLWMFGRTFSLCAGVMWNRFLRTVRRHQQQFNQLSPTFVLVPEFVVDTVSHARVCPRHWRGVTCH